MVVDGAPESVNHMYSRGPHGNTFLKKAGQAFKDRAQSAVVRACQGKDWGRASTQIYEEGGWAELWIELRLPGLHNRSWKPGPIVMLSKSPRAPYQRLDGSNYIKLLEDAVARGTGIDDSLTRAVHVTKNFDWAGAPEVEITYQLWLPGKSV